MAINDEIAAGGRPVQFENPLNNMVKFSNIQNDMANMALHKQKMEASTAAAARQGELDRYLAGGGRDESIIYGLGGVKDLAELRQGESAKRLGEKTKAETAKVRQETRSQAYHNIVYNPSPENIIAHNQDFQLNPDNSPEDKASSKRTADMLVAMPLDQRVAWLASQGASAADLKPSQHVVGAGDRSVVVSTPAYGGQSTEVGSVQMGATPKEKLEYTPKYLAEVAERDRTANDIKKTVALYDNSSGTPMREVFKSQLQDYYTRLDEQDKRIAGMKSEEAELKRPRQEFENLLRYRAALVAKLGAAAKNDPEVKGMTARINYLTTHPGQEPVDLKKVAHVTQNEKGDLINQNAYGTVLSVIKEGGKPSAQYSKAKEQAKMLRQNVDIAIEQIGNAIKPGGLLDRSTGSGIGRGVDIGANLIGKATPGAIAAAELAPIADLAVKLVTRFEGSQSNADVADYKRAAGQLADPTLPIEIRRAAAVKVMEIMKRRKGQFITPEMAAQSEVPAGGGNPHAGKTDAQIKAELGI